MVHYLKVGLQKKMTDKYKAREDLQSYIILNNLTPFGENRMNQKETSRLKSGNTINRDHSQHMPFRCRDLRN